MHIDCMFFVYVPNIRLLFFGVVPHNKNVELPLVISMLLSKHYHTVCRWIKGLMTRAIFHHCQPPIYQGCYWQHTFPW